MESASADLLQISQIPNQPRETFLIIIHENLLMVIKSPILGQPRIVTNTYMYFVSYTYYWSI